MSVVLNEVRKGFYLDSVALMRLSRSVAAREGVAEAALMMGTPANREIMADAGLLAAAGEAAGGGDLVIAIRAADTAAAQAALDEAKAILDAPTARGSASAAWRPRTIRAAIPALPGANLALISVPGAFAAAEARKAIRRGLHAMIFSDNVPLSEEIDLKREARGLGRLVMGPDCGTAIIGGTALAFANVVPRGEIGIVGASGTGIQEVTCQIAQMGGGIAHAIGTGGRDLKAEVGGITTLMAIDALSADPTAKRIVVIGKPPGDEVAASVLDRLGTCGKPAIVCFMGAEAMDIPQGVTQTFTLQETACAAMGRPVEPVAAPELQPRKGGLVGLFSGGTLCAEAQVILRNAGHSVASNAPIARACRGRTGDCVMLDLGDDEFTQGRPHPMIDPTVRETYLAEALGRDDLAAILVDVVIGYGAHSDPASEMAGTLAAHPSDTPVVCAVTGTEADPQSLSRQTERLKAAGVHVAPSNADAARWALALRD